METRYRRPTQSSIGSRRRIPVLVLLALPFYSSLLLSIYAFQPCQSVRRVDHQHQSHIVHPSCCAWTLPQRSKKIQVLLYSLIRRGDVSTTSTTAKGSSESVLDFLETVEATMPVVGDIPEEVSKTSSKSSNVSGDDPELVERRLCRMIDEWKAATEGSTTVEPPTTEDFVTAMKGWESLILTSTAADASARKQDTFQIVSAVDRVWSLFKTLEDLYLDESDDNVSVEGQAMAESSFKPTADVFRIVLRVLASSRQHGIDRKAFQLFQDMREEYNIEADADMYESMIFMLAKSRNKGAANRAENLLREAIEQYPPRSSSSSSSGEDGNERGIGIDSFNVVLTAWAKSKLNYGPERAEKLMLLMNDVGIKPNVSSFTSLLDAYAQRNDWESVCQSERIFNRVLDLYLQGDDAFEPSIVSWNIVMSAWSRLANKKSKDAAAKADRLLRRMEKLHADGRIGFGPDVIVYVTVMNANAFSKTASSLARAQEILDEMNERYMDGDDTFKPTARSIRIIIDSYFSSTLPDKLDQAEDILARYKDHIESLGPPNDPPEALDDIKRIHRAMISGYCQAEEPDLAQKYLKELVNKGMELDLICFDKIIDANTQVSDPGSMKRSYEVFELLEQCRLKGTVQPNERAYSSFIRAMTKAGVPNLASKSRALLNRMNELFEDGNDEIQPTVFTYNNALMACAQSSDSVNDKNVDQSKEDFKIAVSIFNELRSGPGPDPLAFSNMLRCTNLLPAGPQKDALVTPIFELCCEKGLVNSFVLRDLKLCASDELWESLLDCSTVDDEVNVEDLPSSWTRRAADKPTKSQTRLPTKRREFRR